MLILLGIVIWFFPPNDNFRINNPFWNGAENINSQVIQGLNSLSDLPDESQGTTLILIPYISCSAEELTAIGNFINSGGTLVLADDFGYGNQILEYLELRGRFSGESLLDPLMNYKNEQFPKITRFQPGLTGTLNCLVLNHATCLVDITEADIVASSSVFSFLDLDGDLLWEADEPTGPLPVIARYQLGAGQIILISDPSLFINSMDMEDNTAFIASLKDISPAGLYLDQYHLPASELQRTKSLLAKIRGFLTIPAVTIGLVLLVAGAALIPVWPKKKNTGIR